MARGEKPSSPRDATQSNAIGMALVGVFGVASLGAVLFVIVTTRACATCDQWMYGAATMGADPYMGASTAAALLSWRDTSRARTLYGAPPVLDGATAHFMTDYALLQRGYVADEGAPITITLPADVTVEALDRTCGVVEVQAEATSHISSAGRGSVLRTADDPSDIAIGGCGSGPYRVEGVGTALVRVYLMPGVVTGDVERTAIPEEVLLAHAEAERLLAGVGYSPTDEVLRLDVTSSATGIGQLTGIPEPATGCVPWAVVAVGAGRSRVNLPAPISDYATDRALALAVTCAGGGGASIELDDPGGDGYVAWARPYQTSGAIVTAVPSTVRVPDLRVVDAASVTVPPGAPAIPPP